MRDFGEIKPVLVCPHCRMKGQVHTKATQRKAGVSGAKVVAAILTLGLTLIIPGVGLSRWVRVTQAHCDSCYSTWDF